MKAKTFLVAVLVAMTFTAATYAGQNEEEIPWANVPAAVQKTVTENADGGKVGKIEQETNGGKTAYEAKVKKPDGTTLKIKVGEDGKLIEIEDEAD